MEDLGFMKKFDPEATCIKEFKYWIVCVRKRARTLGDAVILLKRQTDSVSNITKDEAIEYSEVIEWYEKTCADKFGATKFNYLMLMMKDNFVHYHAFPRYDKDIIKFDKVWKDEDYPVIVNLKNAEVLDDSLLNKVVSFMRS